MRVRARCATTNACARIASRDSQGLATGTLPMFKSSPKPVETAGVGKYAIRFTWNDGHEHGIYSWEFLREFCPCAVCNDLRTAAKAPGSGVTRTVPH